jgi:tetratricopeptide (TPR) repeat protein
MKKIKLQYFVITFFLLAWNCLLMASPALKQDPADSLEALLKLEIRPEKKFHLLLALSKELENSNPVSGLVFANEALNIAQTLNDKELILSTQLSLVNLYWKSGDLKNGITYGQSAMEMARRMDRKNDFIDASIRLGYIYDDLGDYDKSTELFFNSLKLSEKIGDKARISKSMYGIGFSCFSRNNFKEALEYYQKSLAIYRELHDTNAIAGCLNNISAVYGSLNDNQYIERYVREAVAVNLKMNNKLWVSINYGNLGSYYLERKQYDSAYSYFQGAYNMAVSTQNASQTASTTNQLANYYVITGDYNSGLKYAMEAYNLGNKFGLKKIKYEAALLLRNIYYHQQDMKEAYHYDTLRYILKDSLSLDASNASLSRLELNYELEKSATEIELKEQNRLAATIVTLITLVSAIIIMVLLYVRHRLKSRYLRIEKEKLEAELDFRNKELASNVMSLLKKNEVLSEITQRLIKIQQRTVNEETKDAIENIANDLHKSMEVSIWEEFELRFKQVHHDFYDKLLQRFPDLSPNEQKLCAFLRLNMTNKEISELTGQSIKALETARYRLRIKFGISNSQVNLITFLSSI